MVLDPNSGSSRERENLAENVQLLIDNEPDVLLENSSPLPDSRVRAANSAPLPPAIDLQIPITRQSYQQREQAARYEIALGRHFLHAGIIPDIKTPLSVIDLDLITRQTILFDKNMTGVVGHYAVKCNDTPAIIKHLDSLGWSFDAATAGELEHLAKLGISPNKVICTHPSRTPKDIEALKEFRPRAIVVDSAAEVKKLKEIFAADYHPEIFIRISLKSEGLSGAFGVPVTRKIPGEDGEAHRGIYVSGVRRIVAELQLLEDELTEQFGQDFKFNSVNISTHVGTNTCTVDPYKEVFTAFPVIKEELLKERTIKIEGRGDVVVRPQNLTTLNLGGGYSDTLEPIKYGTTQEKFFTELGVEVRKFQNENPTTPLIAEPGRAIVASAGALYIGVTGVVKEFHEETINGRVVKVPDYRVRLDDGLYGSLMGMIHDDQLFQFVAYSPDGTKRSGRTVSFTLKGATCDSFDKIDWRRALPEDLQPGDVLVVRYAGAYTSATATEFNAIMPPQKLIISRGEDNQLKVDLVDWKGNLLHTYEGPGPDLSGPALSLQGLSPQQMVERLTRICTPEKNDLAYSIVGLLSGTLGTTRPEEAQRLYNEKLERAISGVLQNELTLQLTDLKAIAVGGMGMVFEGIDKLGRRVALKVGLDPAGSELAERMQAEVRQTAELAKRDRRIPSIIDAGVLPEGGLPYYTMELVEGEKLETMIDNMHALSGDRAINWKKDGGSRILLAKLGEAANAIHLAHEQGILHRDIKPDNLMVPFDSRIPIKVIDWGLFKSELKEVELRESLDQPGLTEAGLGTIDYMSPEQARGEEVGVTTDVWALGAVLYRMMYGEVPLSRFGNEATTRLEALRRGSDDLIQLPKREGMPDEVRSIIRKAMMVNPANRYESAEAFASDISNFLEKRAVQAHTESLGFVESSAYSTKLFVQRKTREVAITATLLLAGGASLFGWNKYKEDQQEQQIAVERADNIGNRAREKLQIAQEYADKGRLGEALGALSTDLIAQLEENPIHYELRDEIIAHRNDWIKFSEFEARCSEIKSGSMNTLEFGAVPVIDVAAMMDVSKVYLPEGFTDKGIEALRFSLASSKLGIHQRLQIEDELETALVLYGKMRVPSVIGKKGGATPEDLINAEEIINKVDRVAEACEGVAVGSVTSSSYLSALLRQNLFDIMGNQDRRIEQLNIANALNTTSRASSLFIYGVLEAEAFLDRGETEQYILSSKGSFPEVKSKDPNRIDNMYWLERMQYLEMVRANTQEERELITVQLIDTLEDERRVAPNNPYIAGRLALVCQNFWREERLKPLEERRLLSLHSQGRRAASEYVRLMEEQGGMNLSVLVLDAGAELALSSGVFDEASEKYRRILSIEPGNKRVQIMYASSEIQRGEEINKEEVLAQLSLIAEIEDPTSWVFIEAANIYGRYFRSAQANGNIEDANQYLSLGFACLETAVRKVPQLNGTIFRRANSTFKPFYEHDKVRFDSLKDF